eukprot:5868458-Amphidinium_carterae.1
MAAASAAAKTLNTKNAVSMEAMMQMAEAARDAGSSGVENDEKARDSDSEGSDSCDADNWESKLTRSKVSSSRASSVTKPTAKAPTKAKLTEAAIGRSSLSTPLNKTRGALQQGSSCLKGGVMPADEAARLLAMSPAVADASAVPSATKVTAVDGRTERLRANLEKGLEDVREDWKVIADQMQSTDIVATELLHPSKEFKEGLKTQTKKLNQMLQACRGMQGRADKCQNQTALEQVVADVERFSGMIESSLKLLRCAQLGAGDHEAYLEAGRQAQDSARIAAPNAALKCCNSNAAWSFEVWTGHVLLFFFSQ